MKAEMGTPCGSSHFGSIDGHCDAGTVKRALACAARRPDWGVHSLPCQSIRRAGGGPVMPSHQTSPSGVSATLVKMTFSRSMRMALELGWSEVLRYTPDGPDSVLEQ